MKKYTLCTFVLKIIVTIFTNVFFLIPNCICYPSSLYNKIGTVVQFRKEPVEEDMR